MLMPTSTEANRSLARTCSLENSRAPGVILATHERLRRENFPLVSIIAGRRVIDSRVFVSTWLTSQQKNWILVPAPSFEAARSVYWHWSQQASRKDGQPGCGNQSWLLFIGQFLDSLQAAAAIVAQYPALPVAIATSADALIKTLLDEGTPPQFASAALQGLVAVEPIEDRILTTVITARQLAPLLRSPYEGLIYYMLEARPATRGRFAPNRRVRKPNGKGSYEVDLVSDDAKLVIEIDGAQHRAAVQIKRDETKQRDLEELGYRVRRFSALQVSKDPVGVWHLIAEQLQVVAVEA
jgi:very-short-patch-repair endonuclease